MCIRDRLGNGQANYDVTSEQLTGYIKLMGGVLKDSGGSGDSFSREASQSAVKIEQLANDISLPLDPNFVKAKRTLNPVDIEKALDSSEEFFSLPKSTLMLLGFNQYSILKIEEIKNERKYLRNLLAEQGDAFSEQLLSSDISLFGNELEIIAGGVSTIWGADINLKSNNLNMGRSSGLHALSPLDGKGGSINIKAEEFDLNAGGISTSAVDGLGGDILIDSNNMSVNQGSISADNYYGTGRKHFETGDISISAKKSFVGFAPSIIINSYTSGGAGDMIINTGELIGEGLGSAANTEFWLMAYSGNTGRLEINAEKFDARQVRIINAAMDDRGKLTDTQKQVYGDININAQDINLENFTLFTGTVRNPRDHTIGDVSINAENDINIGGFLWIDHFQEPKQGMGSDIVFSAKNIFNVLSFISCQSLKR